jgi:hypothetical protein
MVLDYDASNYQEKEKNINRSAIEDEECSNFFHRVIASVEECRLFQGYNCPSEPL